MAFTPLSRAGWTASTNDATFGAAANAIDGSTATLWATNGTLPCWLIVDMGSAQTFNCVTVLPRQDAWNDWPGNAAIYVSDDGSTWGSPVASDTFPGNASRKDFNFTSVTKRWVKYQINTIATGSRIFQGAADFNVGSTDGTQRARVTQVAREVLVGANPNARVTQVAREVLAGVDAVAATVQPNMMVIT